MIILSLLAFMAAFTVIVLVHEFGHFLAARKFGVKVYEFSLGFPFSPRVITLFHHKETAFTIRLLPLGGFVSFSQEGGEDNTDLSSTPYRKRALILFAGSLFNMLFAFFIFIPVLIIGKHLDPVNALLVSAQTVWQILSGMIQFFLNAITGHGTTEGLSGPVGIAVMAGQAASKGILNLCYLTGILSMSIGIMNLLPLPALDGGHLAMLILESIRRKPLNPRVYQRVTVVGLALFLVFTVAVTYKDIVKLIA
ncbi:MAG: site-2 protease family protein [Nitrospirota bacterium]